MSNPSKGTRMNKRSKYAIGIASVVLTGTLAVGAVASAAGTGDGIGRRHHIHLTDEQKCDHQEDIAAKVTSVQEKIATRVSTLQDKRAEAQAAGETDRVTNIDRRLDRLAKVSERITAKYGEFQTWAADNCAAA